MKTAGLRMRTPLLLIASLLACTAQAQHHSPYTGEERRAIKALSEEETKQYLAGAGMGYARAAELNGYPGPMHVLELAGQLDLSPEQRVATQRLLDAHKAEARALGAKRIAAEKSLDELFRSGSADERRVAESTRAAAQIEGEYRLAHLETHLKMRALLSDRQVAQYAVLRGYAERKHAH
jgi:Spy/CpxP family protein refolding chaperone